MECDESISTNGMIKNVVESLNSFGYPSTMEISNLEKMIESDRKENWIQFAICVSWLSSKLREDCHLDELVNPISGPEDLDNFRTELNSFLREIHCPYPLNAIWETSSPDGNASIHRLELLNFLCTELQASRVSKRVKRVPSTESRPSPTELLESVVEYLYIGDRSAKGKPPVDMLRSILEEMKTRLANLPNCVLGDPLFPVEMSTEQWTAVETLNDEMTEDSHSRVEMLLKRLDVTIQSFSWSDRLKSRKQEIHDIYAPLRKELVSKSSISMADFVAARHDLAIVEKAASSNQTTKTESKLQKLMLVGAGPPDRGGRPKDVTRMPQWKERIVTGGGAPQHERSHHRKKGGGGGGGDKGKRKPWKDDEASSGPSGTVSMNRRSKKKSKKGDQADGMEAE